MEFMVWICESKIWEKKLEWSAETPGGSAETIEKSKLHPSCKSEGKTTIQKGTKSTK